MSNYTCAKLLLSTVEAARQSATLAKADVTVVDSSFTRTKRNSKSLRLLRWQKKTGATLERVEKRGSQSQTELYIPINLENLVKGEVVSAV